VGFHQELKSRGFDPDSFQHTNLYRYMKDGKKINEAIAEYVRGVIESQYPDDQKV